MEEQFFIKKHFFLCDINLKAFFDIFIWGFVVAFKKANLF